MKWCSPKINSSPTKVVTEADVKISSKVAEHTASAPSGRSEPDVRTTGSSDVIGVGLHPRRTRAIRVKGFHGTGAATEHGHGLWEFGCDELIWWFDIPTFDKNQFKTLNLEAVW